MTEKPSKTNKIKHKLGLKKASDEDLWVHVAATVQPLGEHFKNRTSEVESKLVSVNSGAAGKKLPSRGSLAPAPRPQARLALTELSLSSQSGINKSTSKKLRKGQQRIEARIDLHGMTQIEAHQALDNFIDGAYQGVKRCVLVITGKGLKPDGTYGVIHSGVPRWLKEQPNRSRVLAFTHATPKDGGKGALYVMLKRKR
jgi:DNA-nicking Smr family endonuclease